MQDVPGKPGDSNCNTRECKLLFAHPLPHVCHPPRGWPFHTVLNSTRYNGQAKSTLRCGVWVRDAGSGVRGAESLRSHRVLTVGNTGCVMGQGLGRLARSRRVQLTPIPQADSKQFAATEQKCMAGRTLELLYRQVAGWLEVWSPRTYCGQYCVCVVPVGLGCWRGNSWEAAGG